MEIPTHFSAHLFPEFPAGGPDIHQYQAMIVSRVIENGQPEDWRLIQKLYGLKAIEEHARNSPNLDAIDLHFLSNLLAIPREEFVSWSEPAGIDPVKYDLIRWLLDRPALRDYALAGGTAIAMELKHRYSADIDLFTWEKLNQVEIMRDLGGKGMIIQNGPSSIKFMIEGVKVDLCFWGTDKMQADRMVDGIRTLGLLQLGVMKMQAMGMRYKKSDFIDLYFILQHFSITDMLMHVKQRGINPATALKRLLNFQEAEQDEAPRMLTEVSWEEVKRGLRDKVSAFVFSGNEIPAGKNA